MIVNMIAFGKVSNIREKRRENKSIKEQRVLSSRHSISLEVEQLNRHANTLDGLKASRQGRGADGKDDTELEHYGAECPSSGSDSESPGSNITTDSETIL